MNDGLKIVLAVSALVIIELVALPANAKSPTNDGQLYGPFLNNGQTSSGGGPTETGSGAAAGGAGGSW